MRKIFSQNKMVKAELFFFPSLFHSEKSQICGDNARVLSKRQLFRKLSPNESWQRDDNSSP